MKGFGQSFSTSFENAETRRAAKERDAFQVAYDSISRNSTQYEADKKADEALINSAKTIASQNNLPEESWGEIYLRLKSGSSFDKTEEWARTNKFTVTPATDAPSEAQAPSSVDGQMEELGQVDPASANTAPIMEQPEEEGLLSTVSNNLTEGKGLFGTRTPGTDEERAQSEVGQAMGITPEQMAQYNQGYQSPDLPGNVTVETKQAIIDPLAEFGLSGGKLNDGLAAAKVMVEQYRNSDNPEAQAMAARFDALLPSIEASLAEDPSLDAPTAVELLKASAPIRQPIREMSSAVKDMAASGMALDAFAKEHPEILTMTGAGASALQGIATEANTLLDMIGKMGSEGADEGAVQNAIKQWEASLLSNGTLAESASTFAQHAALQVRFIYASGKAMGQAGNGFSNYDFDNIRKSIQASNNYETYSQNLRSIITERTGSVQNLIDDAMITTEIQILMEDPKYAAQLLVEMQDMEDRLDPTIRAWLNPEVGATTTNDTVATPTGPNATPRGTIQEVDQDFIDQMGGDIPQEALGRTIVIDGNSWEYTDNMTGR